MTTTTNFFYFIKNNKNLFVIVASIILIIIILVMAKIPSIKRFISNSFFNTFLIIIFLHQFDKCARIGKISIKKKKSQY